ncbi:hypothetical protein NB703_003968 [Pantoea ananatis]|uniref:Uncharacterized protein n=1 Tax=Pantoea ananas TaxID=553 RepID=A0AAJ1D215_PANAN|nr:hypothetical protein [Pantoea ananatis]MCW0345875.1 hypothetical protein [Pantoea ananatis]
MPRTAGNGRADRRQLPLSEQQPGYSEGTALCRRRFPAGGREAAKKAERSDILRVSEGSLISGQDVNEVTDSGVIQSRCRAYVTRSNMLSLAVLCGLACIVEVKSTIQEMVAEGMAFVIFLGYFILSPVFAVRFSSVIFP